MDKTHHHGRQQASKGSPQSVRQASYANGRYSFSRAEKLQQLGVEILDPLVVPTGDSNADDLIVNVLASSECGRASDPQSEIGQKHPTENHEGDIAAHAAALTIPEGVADSDTQQPQDNRHDRFLRECGHTWAVTSGEPSFRVWVIIPKPLVFRSRRDT